MAGDWIKMRTDLYRDPKVCVIADYLLSPDSELARYVNQNLQRDIAVTRNVMRNVTVGALVSVWGVLRHRGKRNDDDLIVRGCSLAVVDDLADIPGFGSAMAKVGWIVETDDGLVFPRFFEEFNVDPAEEAKKKNAERQRRYRERQKEKNNVTSNVTVTSQSNVREEKRREYKNNKAQAPFVLPDWIPAESWLAFTEMRKKIRKPLTDRAAQMAIDRLAELRAEGHDPKAVLDHSTLNSYQGLFPPPPQKVRAGGDAYDWQRGMK